jgi:hypothetical protein
LVSAKTRTPYQSNYAVPTWRERRLSTRAAQSPRMVNLASGNFRKSSVSRS